MTRERTCANCKHRVEAWPWWHCHVQGLQFMSDAPQKWWCDDKWAAAHE